MKKIFFVAALALISSGLMAQFTGAGLQAAGLTCAMCTKAINKALEKLSFIGSVEPDIKTSTFNISFKPGAEVDFDQLKKAVEDAGFSVAKLTVTGKFAPVSIQNDAHVVIDGKTFHFLGVKAQTLEGERSLVLVDKDYLSAREFKKYSAASKMSCVQSGRAGACCTKDGITANTRIYHVTI